MIHLGPNLTRGDTEADRSARRRANAVTKMFGGAAGQSGQRLDFSKPSAPAMPTTGTGSLADLYGSTVFRAEIAQRDERAARADKLMPEVRQLAQSHGLDLEALEVLNIVQRASKTMGGNPVQVFHSDLARATGLPAQRVDDILREAVSKGLLEERSRSHWRSKI